MSNRDSLGFGDLLPQDVVDIFSQEKLSKKGRKQRSRSLGRALGWLKGKKNKNVGDKGKNPGLGPAFDLALDIYPAGHQGTPKGAQKSGKQGHQQGNSHAIPKRDEDDEKTSVPLVVQENVFIEVSRPKYLEDLHSEALEGLKLMQQEERIIGPEYQDNESIISTVSARAEVDRGGFTTDSTLPDTSSTVSMQSSVSSRSSRSGLTRQGSTFRPLNSGKKSEKGRTRRRHRKTIGGIPQHLQREFGLDQVEWTVGPQLEEEFVNGDTDVPQLAPHSPPVANSVEVIHPLNSVQEEQLSVSQTVHVDDMALLQRLTSGQSGGDRPWSLAVPGMTTAGSGQPGPPSPVMSMSPQAAYLSKIIPNAVLPPSIEVVEISRGSSRNSVRTVSKSSLVLSSPTSSRASSRASTARSTSSRSSTITSASRQNHFHLSDSSCWSNSDSDTLVSDSSTISSSSTPHQREAQDKVSKKQNKVSVHTASPKYPSNGKIIKGNESKKDGPFVRSLSVMKSKRAPPPPSRSYSLHNKVKRRSRDLVDVKIITPQSSEGNIKKIIDSPGYNADTSSLDEYTGSKSPSPLRPQQAVDFTQKHIVRDASNTKNEALQVDNSTKVISPSSGYSSQDATSPKNPSPKHKKGLLAKLHKLFPATTTADLPTSTVTHSEVSHKGIAPVNTSSDKPSVKALRELFTIPPHPKVQAPPPPPPEVWSHSPRSIELLLGPPAPGNTYAIVKKNPKDKRPYRQSASTATEGTARSEEQKQTNSIAVESKKVHESQEGSLNAHRTNESERLIQKSIDMKEHGNVQVSEILNSMLVRSVNGDTGRLPAIAEEHKIHPQKTKNPSISPARLSPQTPTKKTADVQPILFLQRAVSPESSWPPPPPPVSQANLGSPEETEFPLPPPPLITETNIVLPVQVPPDKSVPGASNEPTSLQVNIAPPLNIPPPPPYTAPPPPTRTDAFSEKVNLFSPQTKDASPPLCKITLSPPKEVESVKLCKPSHKEISHAPPERFDSTPSISAIPPPPKVPPPPPQKLLLDIVPSKITHAPSTKPPLLSSKSEVLPPPDLIPPSPSKEVVAVPSILANVPAPSSFQVSTLAHKEVLPPTESEPTEASSPEPAVQNLNCPPRSEIIITEVTQVVIPPIPPSPPKEVKPPSGDVSPPEPLDVSPSKASTPPPEVVPQLTADEQSTPVEVTLIPPEVSNPPSEEVSIDPPTEVTKSTEELSSPPEVSIPQPEDPSPIPMDEIAQEVHSLTEISTPQIKDVILKPQIEVHSEAPPPPEEVTVPSHKDGSPPNDVLSPRPLEAAEAPPEDISPSPKETSSPDVEVEEAAEPQVTEDLPPSVADESFLPVVVDVSYPQLSEETSTDEVEEALENSQKSSEEKETPPVEVAQIVSSPDNDSGLSESDPALQTEIKLSEDEIDSSLLPGKSSLSPPQSIPPPPPTEQPTSDTLPFHEPNKLEENPSQPDDEVVPLSKPDIPPRNESTSQQEITKDILVPSPIEEVPKEEPFSDPVEQQSLEPANLQTVVEVSKNDISTNDQALSDSSESPKTVHEAEDKEETSSPAETSATTEVPQKPIRRSLVISSPSSPPATVTTPPVPFKDPSPNTAVPTTTITKSPPAMARSMNLQEAIRLRTAARSHNGSSSRLAIHSPPGFDMRKSPTSTASFIFSKSNKKVVIEPRSEVKVEKKTEEPATKTSAEQAKRKDFKVPPPVARKPKPKTKEVETDDTAGQDMHSDTIKDITQKPNGTARTVEGH